VQLQTLGKGFRGNADLGILDVRRDFPEHSFAFLYHSSLSSSSSSSSRGYQTLFRQSWMVGMIAKRPAADGGNASYLLMTRCSRPIDLHGASRTGTTTRTIWLRLRRAVPPILSHHEIVCFSRCRVNESESFGIAALGLDSLYAEKNSPRTIFWLASTVMRRKPRSSSL
jgi:hypothetical protein